MAQTSINKVTLKITYLKVHSNLPGANELIGNHYGILCPKDVDELIIRYPGLHELMYDLKGENEYMLNLECFHKSKFIKY